MKTSCLLILSVAVVVCVLTPHSLSQRLCRYKCSTVLEPVCARANQAQGGQGCRAFDNECMRLSFNCQNEQQYDHLFDGACNENCERT